MQTINNTISILLLHYNYSIRPQLPGEMGLQFIVPFIFYIHFLNFIKYPPFTLQSDFFFFTFSNL